MSFIGSSQIIKGQPVQLGGNNGWESFSSAGVQKGQTTGGKKQLARQAIIQDGFIKDVTDRKTEMHPPAAALQQILTLIGYGYKHRL